MNKLIEITSCNLGAENINAVNSRDLYNKLELAKGQYSRWIKSNLLELFSENFDFIGVRQIVEGNPTISYMVTLDTAKHLCMIAKTEKAMEFRKYFIEVEKKANKPLTYEETMQNALLLADNRVKELEHKIVQDKPLTDFGRAISQSNATVKIGDWIKAINNNGDIKIGRNKVFEWFRKNGYLCKNNTPMQRYIHQGLFEVKEGLITTDIKSIATFTTLLTAKGQVYFMEKLKGEQK